MPISEARKRANENYLKTQDEIRIRIPKGQKAEIQAYAKAQGKSLNAYIVELIRADMNKCASKLD